jgi:ATP-binding cassette subfamily B protein
MRFGRLMTVFMSKRIGNLRRALVLVWRSAPWLTAASVGLILIEAVLPVLLLYAVKLFIDATTAALSAADPVSLLPTILPYLGLAAGIALAQAGVGAIGRFLQDAQSQAVTDYMYGLLHHQAIVVDLGYFDDVRYRDSLHRAQREAPFRPGRVLASVLDVGRNAVALAAMGGLLVSFHWAVLPALVIAGLPGGLVRLGFARRLYRLDQEQTQRARQANYYDSLLLGVPFAQEIRLLSLGRHFSAKSRATRRQLRRERLRITGLRSAAEFLTETFAAIGLFGVVALLGHQTLAGLITVGSLFMYFQALQRGWANFGQTLRGIANLREHSLFIDDVYRFLDLAPAVASPARPLPVPRPLRKGLELAHVSFAYPNSEVDAVHDVSLSIGPGQHVAIVGHNGSGKSTLVKLICRLYDPRAGTIRLDGIDLDRFDPEALRGEIAVHVQGFARFQETLRENIRLGAVDRALDDAAIAEAARQSGADAIAARLPRGYDTMLGKTFEGGQELSAGNWQKLALARAFVREAQIVILDEPTASLDATSGRELIQRFHALTEGRTAIIISHRLSAVLEADRIYVMDEGRIVESGTHGELVAANGRYAQLFRLQDVASS